MGLDICIDVHIIRSMETKQTETKEQIVQNFLSVFDSKIFKTLSEPVRREILKVLLLHGRSDIGAIAQQLPQDRSVISRHLQLMHEVGILNCTKESRFRYYSINGEHFLAAFEKFSEELKCCLDECCPTGCCD